MPLSAAAHLRERVRFRPCRAEQGLEAKALLASRGFVLGFTSCSEEAIVSRGPFFEHVAK